MIDHGPSPPLFHRLEQMVPDDRVRVILIDPVELAAAIHFQVIDVPGHEVVDVHLGAGAGRDVAKITPQPERHTLSTIVGTVILSWWQNCLNSFLIFFFMVFSFMLLLREAHDDIAYASCSWNGLYNGGFRAAISSFV